MSAVPIPVDEPRIGAQEVLDSWGSWPPRPQPLPFAWLDRRMRLLLGFAAAAFALAGLTVAGAFAAWSALLWLSARVPS